MTIKRSQALIAVSCNIFPDMGHAPIQPTLWEAWQSLTSLLLAMRADKSYLLLDTAKVAKGLTVHVCSISSQFFPPLWGSLP